MSAVAHVLSDLEAKAAAGHPFTAEEAARLLSTADLVSVGVVGEAARRALSGDAVSFGRVLEVPHQEGRPEEATLDGKSLDAAGEVRIVGIPASIDQAVEWVRRANVGHGRCVTGFSLADLWVLAGEEATTLTHIGRRLSEAGLQAIAEMPIDRFDDADRAVSAVQATVLTGLGVWRATVHQAAASVRLGLILRAAEVQRRTGQLRALAPLPRTDLPAEPSTGYDDVKTIAAARTICAAIPFIQVDWPIYGPKLAQVAIAFGANDIDGVGVVDQPEMGPRRAAVEEITRQIRAASATPVERDGRYERRS
jgi:aminodeoxyfutalosine synthase